MLYNPLVKKFYETDDGPKKRLWYVSSKEEYFAKKAELDVSAPGFKPYYAYTEYREDPYSSYDLVVSVLCGPVRETDGPGTCPIGVI